MKDLFKDFTKTVESTEFPEKRMNKVIKMAMKDAKKKKGRSRKIILYLSNAAALFLCFLLLSAFVSPPVARTLSRTPIIGTVFIKADSSELIVKSLEENGYKTDSIIYQFHPEKEVIIHIGGADTNIQEINDDEKKVVNNVLHSEGYNSFNIIVSQSEYVQIIETEEKAQNEEAYMAEWNSSGVLPIINKELNKEEKFYVDSINTGILDGAMKWKIKLSLESNDASVSTVTKEIEEKIRTIIDSQELKSKIDGLPYQIEIYDKNGIIVSKS